VRSAPRLVSLHPRLEICFVHDKGPEGFTRPLKSCPSALLGLCLKLEQRGVQENVHVVLYRITFVDYEQINGCGTTGQGQTPRPLILMMSVTIMSRRCVEFMRKKPDFYITSGANYYFDSPMLWVQ